MKYHKLQKKINTRKLLLNTLLNYFKPTSKLMVYLSQDLDKLIVEAQKIKAQKHKFKAKTKSKSLVSQVAWNSLF